MTTQNRPYALTVKQPWADLIMAGVKDVENRTWPVPSTLPEWLVCTSCGMRGRPGVRGLQSGYPWTFDCSGRLGHHPIEDGPFPFRLWIHAAQQWDKDAPNDAWEQVDPTLAISDDRFGALLGSVTVTGCHHTSKCRRLALGDGTRTVLCSRWAEPHVWHWTLVDPEPLSRPIPMRGRQRLWRLPEDIAQEVAA